jgi:hypothetical protein
VSVATVERVCSKYVYYRDTLNKRIPFRNLGWIYLLYISIVQKSNVCLRFQKPGVGVGCHVRYLKRIKKIFVAILCDDIHHSVTARRRLECVRVGETNI